MVSDQLNGLGGGNDLHALAAFLLWLYRGYRFRHRALRHPPKVAGCQRFDIRRVHITGNRDRYIGGHVVLFEKPPRVFRAQVFNVTGPAHRRNAIRVRLHCGGEHGFLQTADGFRFGSHATLFADHAAFPVEFAQHGAHEAGRFQIEPKLSAVGRQIVEVAGIVFAGSGVQTHPAALFDDAGVEIGHHEGIRLFHGGFERFLKGLQPGRGAGWTLIAFGFQLIVGSFHQFQHKFLGRIVRRADGFGTLERHVLEHVRDPRFALGIVHRPGIYIGVERDHRSRVTLQHNEVQTVGQVELSDVFFEFPQILGGNTRRQGKGK